MVGIKTLVAITVLVGILLIVGLPLASADPDPGVDGVLWVYTDSGYLVEAPWYDANKHSYVANIGDKYWINVTNIDDPSGVKPGDTVLVKVCYNDTSGNPACTILGTTTIQGVTGDGWFAIGPWTVPSDAKFCTTTTVHFYNVTSSGEKVGEEWVAGGQFFKVGHMHVIPEAAFGVFGSLAACMTGLVAFSGLRRKNPARAPKV